METIGLFEAKTHLSAIIEKVRGGQDFTITHRGKPVAVLKAYESDAENQKRERRKKAIEYFRNLKKVPLPEGYTIKKMIEEGRV